MFDARKILVIFLIGILYTIFSYSLIDSIYPSPEYQDFCRDEFMTASMKIQMGYVQNCTVLPEIQCERNAIPRYTYNSNGCPTAISCDYCQNDYDNARENRNLIVFIFSSALGVIALAIGFLLPQKKNPMNKWIATGFLLGGLITIFIGTAVYYGDMARILRPIVMLLLLVLVIFLAYRQIRTR